MSSPVIPPGGGGQAAARASQAAARVSSTSSVSIASSNAGLTAAEEKARAINRRNRLAFAAEILISALATWALVDSLQTDDLDTTTIVSECGQATGAVTGLVGLWMTWKDSESLILWWVFIMDTAANVVGVTQLMGADPDIDTGVGFDAGSVGFNSLDKNLSALDPDPAKWQGVAKDRYEKLNKEQTKLVQMMSDADRRMAEVVANQAELALSIRRGMVGITTTLKSASMVCALWAAIAAATKTTVGAGALNKLKWTVDLAVGAAFAALAALLWHGWYASGDAGQMAHVTGVNVYRSVLETATAK